MSKPANFCDECKHFIDKTEDIKNVCELKHKPRFYEPKTYSQVHMGVWGWKRRCDDFIYQGKKQ
jgi:hypothetical protein